HRPPESHAGPPPNSAAVEACVPFDCPSDTVPADADEWIPHARFAREARQGTEGGLVVGGKTTPAAFEVQIGGDASSYLGVAVEEIHVDLQKGSIGSITADRGPEPVAFDAPDVVGRGHPTEERTVETDIEQLTPT